MTNNKPLSFISLFLLVSAVAVSARDEVEPVKDTNGNPLKSQTHYFIQPGSDTKRGGLVPESVDYNLCPLGVVLSRHPYQPGQPVNFSGPSSQNGVVSTNTDLIIEFQSSSTSYCSSSKIWKVDRSSTGPYENYVSTGGSSSTRASFFRIQKYGNDQNIYKFVHYKSSSVIKGIDINIGYFGAPILVLKDIGNDDKNFFPVKFREVDTSTEKCVCEIGSENVPFFLSYREF